MVFSVDLINSIAVKFRDAIERLGNRVNFGSLELGK